MKYLLFLVLLPAIGFGQKVKDSYTYQFTQCMLSDRTPELAKRIYLDQLWTLQGDETGLFNLLDSVTHGSNSTRAFYFKVVTKTFPRSDGAYSEVLYGTAYDYILNNTTEFLHYFTDTAHFTNADMERWVEGVTGEMQVAEEGRYNEPLVEEYTNKMKQNCADCTGEEKIVLEKFTEVLRLQWAAVVKSTDK